MDDDTKTMSPEQAQQELDSTYGAALNDPSHPFNNASDPRHARSVARMYELRKRIVGDEEDKPLGEGQGLAQALEGLTEEDIKAAQQKREDSLLPDAELKEEWGAAYEQNVRTAQDAVAAVSQEFDSPELIDLLEETGLGDHPAIIKLFHKIGEGLKKAQ